MLLSNTYVHCACPFSVLIYTCMNETLYSWTFNFHTVVRQHNSGVAEDFILPYSAVYLQIQKWKNYWNRSTFAKVVVKIKVARFFMVHGVHFYRWDSQPVWHKVQWVQSSSVTAVMHTRWWQACEASSLLELSTQSHSHTVTCNLLTFSAWVLIQLDYGNVTLYCIVLYKRFLTWPK